MNYYKILNDEACHKGLQYPKRGGLVKDPVPFNPSGDCEPGGIYFAREDILAFLHFGPWIARVTLPKGARVYENPGKPRKWKANKVILGRRRKITTKVLEELIDEGANIHADNDYALRWAALNGHLDIMKFLVEKGANMHAYNDYALRVAAKNGHLDIVKYLVSASANIHAGDDYALRLAADNGHTKVVRYLERVAARESKEKPKKTKK